MPIPASSQTCPVSEGDWLWREYIHIYNIIMHIYIYIRRLYTYIYIYIYWCSSSVLPHDPEFPSRCCPRWLQHSPVFWAGWTPNQIEFVEIPIFLVACSIFVGYIPSLPKCFCLMLVICSWLKPWFLLSQVPESLHNCLVVWNIFYFPQYMG